MAKSLRGAKRETEILAVARQTLLTEGLDGFVLRSIADRLEMKLGNLQYYFATRYDLLEALLRSELAGDLHTLESVATEDPDADFQSMVEALMNRWGTTEGNIYLPIGVLALTNQRFGELWSETYDAFYAAITRLIRRIDPSITPSVALARAIAVTALLDGASIQPYRPTGPTSKKAMSKIFLKQALTIAKGQHLA